MMVMGISGSPRKGGNTEFLLNEALGAASERGFEIERLLCSEISIGFCRDCGNCAKGKTCPEEDDISVVLQTMEKADGIIVASPVYFGSITGQLKTVFDRTIPLRRQGMKLKDKVGCGITVGGARNGGQEKAMDSIHSWMHIQGIIVVGDSSHFGGIAVRPASEDRIGRKTVLESANKLCNLLERTEKKLSCWAGD